MRKEIDLEDVEDINPKYMKYLLNANKVAKIYTGTIVMKNLNNQELSKIKFFIKRKRVVFLTENKMLLKELNKFSKHILVLLDLEFKKLLYDEILKNSLNAK